VAAWKAGFPSQPEWAFRLGKWSSSVQKKDMIKDCRAQGFMLSIEPV
jgi:hypothetical protein